MLKLFSRKGDANDEIQRGATVMRHHRRRSKGITRQASGIAEVEEKADSPGNNNLSLEEQVEAMLSVQGMSGEAAAKVMELGAAQKYMLLQGFKLNGGVLPTKKKRGGSLHKAERDDGTSGDGNPTLDVSDAASAVDTSAAAPPVSTEAEQVEAQVAETAAEKAAAQAAAEKAVADKAATDAARAIAAAEAAAEAAVAEAAAAAEVAAAAAAAEAVLAAVAAKAAEEAAAAALVAAEDLIAMMEDDARCAEAVTTLEELSTDAEWSVQFLLRNGLDVLGSVLRRLVLLPSPSDADVTLMASVISRQLVLINENQLGMVAAIGTHEEMADLRRACAIDEPPPRATDASPTFAALALCVDPSRPTSIRNQLGVEPLLVAAAEESAASHAALLAAFEHAAVTRATGRARLADVVESCRPPTDGADLGVASRMLALLNALISSPASLDARLELREECMLLGLQAHVDALTAATSADADAPDAGPPAHQLLHAHLKLFTSERLADEREARIRADPLAEFNGECVVLFTSIVSSKRSVEEWHMLEVLLRGKSVGFHGVDGSLPHCKAAREALWAVSGARGYPQVFVDNKYVGDHHKIVTMIEADEAHEDSKHHLNEIKRAHAAADGEASPTAKQGHFWANMEKKKVHLPKMIGFLSTFSPYFGLETHVEAMSLDDDEDGW